MLRVEITCPQAYIQTSKQASTCHTEKISHSDLMVQLKRSFFLVTAHKRSLRRLCFTGICLSTEGGGCPIACWDKPPGPETDTPWADTPQDQRQTPPLADTPWADTPQGRQPPGRHPLGRHPPGKHTLGRHPPRQSPSLGRHSLWADTPRADTPQHPPPTQCMLSYG